MSVARRLVLVTVALALAIAAGKGVAALHRRLTQPPQAPPLPVLGTVPDFALEDQEGRTVDAARDLRGRVWVAGFIFTSCAGTCPGLTGSMAELGKAYGELDDFRLVSISVDPERDTRGALAAFAARHGADARRWSFLRGERGALLALAREGFKLSASTPGTAANESAVHSNRLVLVDRHMRIRGYYDGTDAAACATLKDDASRLLAAEAPP